MFISIVLLIFGIVSLITLRDWVTHRASSKLIQKTFKKISQYISLQEWEKAERELQFLLEHPKKGQEALLFEIQILRGKGEFHKALHKAEIQRQAYPEELLFRFEEGQILLALGKSKEALEAFQICSPILRSESDLLALASALCQTGHPKGALDLLDPLLKTTQNDQIALLAGNALYELKLFAEALMRYQQAITLGCTSHYAFTQLGHSFRRLGNLAEAEKIFRELLDKDAHDIDAMLGLGASLQERGQHNKALLIYQAGLIFAPKDLRLLHQAAFAAFWTKKYRFAQLYFSEVMQHQEPDPQVLAYFGFCLENQKKWPEAEQTYLKLTQLFPHDYHGYRALAWMFGVGLSQTLSQNQGMNCAHHALKLKNDPLSWEILSACSARTGQFDKAYQIQISLSKQDKDTESRIRRQQALRTLRKKIPLGDTQVSRTQVVA